jgi:hypothetical protein
MLTSLKEIRLVSLGNGLYARSTLTRAVPDRQAERRQQGVDGFSRLTARRAPSATTMVLFSDGRSSFPCANGAETPCDLGHPDVTFFEHSPHHVIGDARLSRFSGPRGPDTLERAGLVSLARRPGTSPVVLILGPRAGAGGSPRSASGGLEKMVDRKPAR